MARGLKFRIEVVEELYYPYSENKGADQLRSYCATAQLICVFVFAHANSRFFQDEAHMKKSRFPHDAAHLLTISFDIPTMVLHDILLSLAEGFRKVSLKTVDDGGCLYSPYTPNGLDPSHTFSSSC